MMKIKRTIAIILIIGLCLSLIACTSQGTTSGDTAGSKTSTADQTSQASSAPSEVSGKLFEKPFEVTMLYGDATSWPFKEDWYVKKTIEEETGVTLKVTLVDATALSDRINMLMASGDLPDIISHIGMGKVREYALQGPFVNIAENLDKMPNFKKWTENNQDKIIKYLVSDGSLYSLPNIGGGITNTRFWFYRDDIFGKYSLTAPKTPDELYDVLKVLKENNPESYPLNYREFPNLCPSWYTNSGVYYDEDGKQFKFGPIEDNYKELVVFLRKLYEEGLIPPDIYSMDSKAWTDMMVQGKSFITFDYIGRISGLLESGKQLNPDYSLKYMPPINERFPYSPVEYDCVTISKAGRNDEKINNLLKYADWFYSDDAYELLSWGKEGVTYEVVNGKKQFKDINYRAAYGIGNRGWFGVMDTDPVKSTYPEVVIFGLSEQPKYELPENPASYISLNEQELEVTATKGTSINKYVQQEVSQFVIGEKSMDEWDSFVNNIKSMGIDEVLKAYDTAYKRITE